MVKMGGCARCRKIHEDPHFALKDALILWILRTVNFWRSSCPSAWCVPPGTRPSRPPVHRAPERAPLPALPCGISHRKSLSRNRGVSPFRTTRLRSQAPLRSKPFCTVPASGAQTPQAWRKLGVKGAFPPLRPAALRLREAWVIPPVAAEAVMVKGVLPAPTVLPLLCC